MREAPHWSNRFARQVPGTFGPPHRNRRLFRRHQSRPSLFLLIRLCLSPCSKSSIASPQRPQRRLSISVNFPGCPDTAQSCCHSHGWTGREATQTRSQLSDGTAQKSSQKPWRRRYSRRRRQPPGTAICIVEEQDINCVCFCLSPSSGKAVRDCWPTHASATLEPFELENKKG